MYRERVRSDDSRRAELSYGEGSEHITRREGARGNFLRGRNAPYLGQAYLSDTHCVHT